LRKPGRVVPGFFVAGKMARFNAKGAKNSKVQRAFLHGFDLFFASLRQGFLANDD
jgi:hypothetical protein